MRIITTSHPLSRSATESGQVLVEYALVLAVVSAGCFLILGSIGQDVLALFSKVLPGFA